MTVRPAPAPSHPTPGTATSGGSDRLDRALVTLALVLMLGSLAAGLDTTIANVAIPTLGRHFDAPVSTVQWVSTGYLLALTTVVPLTAWAVERFGARRMWIASLATFLVGSLLCGAAWSITSLVAFRVVQGLGGGMLLPLVRIILARAAGRERMGRAMVFVAVPGSLTPVLGPVLGGLVVHELGWRWAFYINAPVCLLGLALARRLLPVDGPRARATRLDVRGLTLLCLGLAAIVYGLSEAGRRNDFGATAALVPLTLGVLLLVGYVAHALLTPGVPIIDLRLFRVRSFAAASAMLCLLGASLFGGLFLLPLYYQQARHASALHAGLLLAPLGIGMSLAMAYVGRLIDRTGAERAVTLAGLGLAVVGLVPFALVAAHPGQLVLATALFVTGIGLGTVMLAAFTATYRGLTTEQMGPATSAGRILQQVGGVLGTAVLAIVLQRSADSGTATAAFGHTFTWALVLTALAVVPALALPRGSGGVRRQ